MRKTFFIIVLLIIGCAKENIPTVSNFPTIILQSGIEKTIDITKYISDFDKISVGKTDGVFADYSADSKLLKLIADGSKSLVLLLIQVNGESFSLLVRVNPMVAHTFTYTRRAMKKI